MEIMNFRPDDNSQPLLRSTIGGEDRTRHGCIVRPDAKLTAMPRTNG